MRTVTLEDLYKFRWLSNPTFSPNGRQVVYEKTVARKKENDYETHLWLSDVTGKSQHVLTTSGSLNKGAMWSKDGKTIAFLSNRSEGVQLWTHTVEHGENRMITRFQHGMSSFVIAPDSRTIYALLPVDQEKKEIELIGSDMEKEKTTRSYDTLYYKFDGGGYSTDLKKQIVAIDIETGSYKQIINATYNIEELTISPDGKYIAFIKKDYESSNPLYNGTLFRVSTTGGKVEKLCGESNCSSPSYSPDGKWIAFLGGKIHKQLFVIPSNGGEGSCLSEQYPGSFVDLIYTDMRYIKSTWKPQWSNDSKHVYTLSGHQGTNEIVRFSISEKEKPVTVIGGGRAILHFTYNGEQTFIVAYSSPATPSKVAAIHLSVGDFVTRIPRKTTEELTPTESFFPSQEVCLDDNNDKLLSEISVVEPETFSYLSEDGWKVHGFMLKPANFEPGKKYPIVLDIHGGPHSTHGFAYFQQMQLLSAQGYAVVYVNPRGSSGYGKDFAKAVQGEYGSKDMSDILNGLDEAMKRYDFLDETRIAVNGLSYGGYMTNWLITRTDRFFAAISEGGISNWVSMYGTSDIAPGFIDEEFAGDTSIETLWKLSPLAYVDKVQTPLLVIHAEDDLRVPIEQGEQFYSYIKRQGKEARFVRIPECTHLMLQIGAPSKRIARLKSILQWLNKYLPE